MLVIGCGGELASWAERSYSVSMTCGPHAPTWLCLSGFKAGLEMLASEHDHHWVRVMETNQFIGLFQQRSSSAIVLKLVVLQK